MPDETLGPAVTAGLAETLVEASPDALLAASPAGDVLFWNHGAEAIFGYARAEAAGRSIFELIVPSHLADKTHKALAETVETGDVTYESVRRTKDGGLVLVDGAERVVRDTQGRVDFIVVRLKDITALRSVHEATRMQARFGGLLESVPDAIVVANGLGRIVLVNSRTEKCFGYSREQLLGKPVEILVPERSTHAHAGHRSGYVDGPRMGPMGAGFEVYGRRRDGSEFPVEISLSPLETDDGVVTLSAIRDISDHRRAAEKVRGLLESAPEAIVIVNGEGRIVLMNGQTERLFGYAPDELLNKPIETLVPARDHGAHTRHRGGYVANPRVRAMGLYGLRKDGTEVPVEISLSPLETEEGLLVATAIRDITGRKRLEDTRQEQNRRLQETNRLKSEFLANLSHELRTPLNGFIGFAALIHDGKAGPVTADHREFLAGILTSARHLLQLINDVLDLSKVEPGNVELPPEGVAGAGVRTMSRAGARAQRGRPILVVDDDPASLKLADRTLRQFGYRAVCCAGAESALRAAAAEPPAAVVLDLVMPRVDRFEFLKRFRRTEAGRGVPVIVWTVKELSWSERRRLAASIAGIVVKGHGAAALLDELRVHLTPAPASCGR